MTDSGNAQASYYTWVDHTDIFGLGRNVPFATGNLADSLEVLVDGKFVTLRIPYPMGFHAKGMTGASTIRKRAGRAEECGRLTPEERPIISKEATDETQSREVPAPPRSAGEVKDLEY